MKRGTEREREKERERERAWKGGGGGADNGLFKIKVDSFRKCRYAFLLHNFFLDLFVRNFSWWFVIIFILINKFSRKTNINQEQQNKSLDKNARLQKIIQKKVQCDIKSVEIKHILFEYFVINSFSLRL